MSIQLQPQSANLENWATDCAAFYEELVAQYPVKIYIENAQELEVYPKGVKGVLTISHVTGIGEPYGLSCVAYSKNEKMQPVHIPIGFRQISDKYCSEIVYDGIITLINGEIAILKTQIPIRMFQNISLCAENEVFCKVVSVEKQGLLLRFTAGHRDFCARAIETASV